MEGSTTLPFYFSNTIHPLCFKAYYYINQYNTKLYSIFWERVWYDIGFAIGMGIKVADVIIQGAELGL